MMKKTRIKFVGVVILAIFTIAFSVPKIPYLPEKAQNYLNDKFKINLGLDLQGGLHLEYQMDLSQVSDDKKKEAIDAAQAVVERRVNSFGVGEPIIQHAKRGSEDFLIVEFPGASNVEDVKSVIDKTPFLQFREEKTAEELKEDEKMFAPQNEKIKGTALDTLNKIKNGGNFDDLYKEKNPDFSDDQLEFVSKNALSTEIGNIVFSKDLGDNQVYTDLVETDNSFYIIKKIEVQGEGDEQKAKFKVLSFGKIIPAMFTDFQFKATDLDGKHLKRADVNFSGNNGISVAEPVVSLKFDDEGTKLFGEITKRNVGKKVAIYLDDKLVSAPVVNTEILTGEAVISGNFSVQDAKDLAKSLNEGALPVPIKLVSQQSVGASLGSKSLEMGLKAGLIGLVLTMIYMIFYYRLFGFIASIALIIYASLNISLFKLSSGLSQGMAITLTLAGIAGLILSIGMAVDANVLIFERIKEELRKGKSLKTSVSEGFERAWSSIRDGNYSTIITSLILMMMGTGFVKGFALILIIGVLFSMFTAIVLVRIVIQFISRDWLENNTWLIFGFKKKAEIENNENIKFWQIIGKRKIAYGFSLILIALSVFAVSNWGLKLGIDFTGGTLAEFKISDEFEMPNRDKICDILGEDGCDESFSLQTSDDNHIIVRYKQSEEEFNQRVLAAIKQVDENVESIRTDFIGATVSNQLKKGAVQAVIWSVVAILIYIAIAFRKVSYPVSSWNYGLGAVVALAHDIFITIGVFAFLGHFYNIEVGVSFIAALLTILGYSVNDTIVVYDRIRENVIKSRDAKNFEDLINKSLNETLARSINTSLTVVIVLTAIVLFGGESLFSFSLALLIGVMIGTYSSIFVATALLVSIYKYKIGKKIKK